MELVELDELQHACDTTTLGFEDCVREWDRVLEFGERWVEGTFFRRARAMGNDIGYDSIVGGGRHATTLHWIDNTGPITPGEMVLLDMGAEATSLYTADVTRTLPIDGRYTRLQRELYSLVLKAQQAGIDAVRPGAAFRAAHQAAMECVEDGRYEALALSPLSSGRLDPPDIALFYATPGAMIYFINGLQWAGYKRFDWSVVGESACADSWGRALKTRTPSLSIPCFAERRYGGSR